MRAASSTPRRWIPTEHQPVGTVRALDDLGGHARQRAGQGAIVHEGDSGGHRGGKLAARGGVRQVSALGMTTKSPPSARDLLLRKRDPHSYSRAVTTVRIQG